MMWQELNGLENQPALLLATTIIIGFLSMVTGTLVYENVSMFVKEAKICGEVFAQRRDLLSKSQKVFLAVLQLYNKLIFRGRA